MQNVALKLENIVKIYGEGDTAVKALKGIDLTFRKNEFVSILGPSGCGKTTMLNIIGGLDRYTSGDLIIEGKSTKEYKDGDWDTYRNNSIGFVFQSYNLIPHQTVLSNVELALTLSGVKKSERKNRATEALKKVGLKKEINKLPNQLSGGQMQRVAIARALVNDPEIILADEPTGALDTETSIAIMELLKEVAKDRLVIMVTHNPELAKKYSTRIINFLDGEKTGDTNPYVQEEVKEKNEKEEKKIKKGKSSMKFFTALSLSLSNLMTKKGRTILTSIAGSIGIIGIALVLAVSTGFGLYVNNLQANTLSVYPVTVSEATVDLTDFNKLLDTNKLDKFPNIKKIAVKEMFSNLTSMLKSNLISDEYVSYVSTFIDDKNESAKNTDKKWAYCLQKSYGLDVNNYIWSDIGLQNGVDVNRKVMPVDIYVKSLQDQMKILENSDMNITTDFVRQYIPTMSEIPENLSLIESQYDLLEGKWPSNEKELLLVVDSTNRISDITLALLGYKVVTGIEFTTDGINVTFDDVSEFSFSDAMSKKFYYVENDARFEQNGDTYYQKIFKPNEVPTSGNSFEMSISGIVRIRKDVSQGVLDTGIAYTSDLVKYILNDGKNSAFNSVVESKGGSVGVVNPLILASKTAKINILDPEYDSKLETAVKESTKIFSARQLGTDDTISKISIYSVDYESKEEIKRHLDKWNKTYQAVIDSPTATDIEKEEANKKLVHYSDSTSMLFFALNSIVDAVKYVLIAFTSISLVVSSIMIGIITYVSVVERTKEIGILRSLGARKMDISRIFNAETFLIGLFAGLIGVGVTYLLTIPINLILGSLIENIGRIAILKITDALLLVAISFVLTLIAGIIPSRIAAKKDPVVALRTE